MSKPLLSISTSIILLVVFIIPLLSANNLSALDEIAQMMKEQEEFCANPKAYARPDLDAKLTMVKLSFEGTEFRIMVYKDNDYVSKILRSNTMWEYDQLEMMSKFIKAYKKAHSITDPSKIHILDIGANMGWYTVIFGVLGYRITAFEPMDENVYIMRQNLCLNPSIKAVILKKAVSETKKMCKMYSGADNFGDTSITCDGLVPPNNLIFRRNFEVVKLDDYADYLHDVTVIKIDIEANEYKALRGGRQVFLNMHIPYIQSEFMPLTMSKYKDNPLEYLQEYVRAGYKIRQWGQNKNFLTQDELSNLRTFPELTDLYIVHESAVSILPKDF